MIGRVARATSAVWARDTGCYGNRCDGPRGDAVTGTAGRPRVAALDVAGGRARGLRSLRQGASHGPTVPTPPHGRPWASARVADRTILAVGSVNGTGMRASPHAGEREGLSVRLSRSRSRRAFEAAIASALNASVRLPAPSLPVRLHPLAGLGPVRAAGLRLVEAFVLPAVDFLSVDVVDALFLVALAREPACCVRPPGGSWSFCCGCLLRSGLVCQGLVEIWRAARSRVRRRIHHRRPTRCRRPMTRRPSAEAPPAALSRRRCIRHRGGDQLGGLDTPEREQHLGLMIEASPDAVEHRRHVLAHGGPVGAGAAQRDVAWSREQPSPLRVTTSITALEIAPCSSSISESILPAPGM